MGSTAVPATETTDATAASSNGLTTTSRTTAESIPNPAILMKAEMLAVVTAALTEEPPAPATLASDVMMRTTFERCRIRRPSICLPLRFHSRIPVLQLWCVRRLQLPQDHQPRCFGRRIRY